MEIPNQERQYGEPFSAYYTKFYFDQVLVHLCCLAMSTVVPKMH